MAVATAAPTKTYEQLVEEGRQIVRERDDTNWKAGDKALEVESLKAGQQPQNAQGFVAGSLLKKYADDIEVNYKTLVAWRGVSEAWPRGRRGRHASWTVHKVLRSQSDRFELIAEVQSLKHAKQIVRDRDRPEGKPDVLPASFDERFISSLGQMAGQTSPFENLARANDGRKFRERHIKACATYGLIVQAKADLLIRIGNGEFEAVDAQEFVEILSRPWAEEGSAHGDDHR